jgi:hypothetical protein
MKVVFVDTSWFYAFPDGIREAIAEDEHLAREGFRTP